MINTLAAKIFGTKNEREVKRLMPQVQAISALEPEMQKLSDEQLRAKTEEFRQRVQQRLSRIPDEPDADFDRLKEIEEERSQALNEVLERNSGRGICRGTRSRTPRAQHAAFRCAAYRRHGSAQRQRFPR